MGSGKKMRSRLNSEVRKNSRAGTCGLQLNQAAARGAGHSISDLQETIKQLRSSYFEAGSINVRSVSGSKRFCIVTGSTVTMTSSVGDTYAARTWPARVVPSGAPTT